MNIYSLKYSELADLGYDNKYMAFQYYLCLLCLFINDSHDFYDYFVAIEIP